MDQIQQDTFNHDQVRVLDIELRDVFGQKIDGWTVAESHGEYGGMGTLAALMDAVDVVELRAPFTPMEDKRAQWYFNITLRPDTRVRPALVREAN